jgi:hypothetical protein
MLDQDILLGLSLIVPTTKRHREIAIAVAGVGLLCASWTMHPVRGAEAGPIPAAVQSGPVADEEVPSPSDVAPASPSAAEVPGRAMLPPLSAFSTILERPLFDPTRRPPPTTVIPIQRSFEMREEQLPSFRLIGTVRQRGRTYGIVALGGDLEVERVTVGEEVQGWMVDEISNDLLVVTRGDQSLRLEILR